jgi:hypothetical protein
MQALSTMTPVREPLIGSSPSPVRPRTARLFATNAASFAERARPLLRTFAGGGYDLREPDGRRGLTKRDARDHTSGSAGPILAKSLPSASILTSWSVSACCSLMMTVHCVTWPVELSASWTHAENLGGFNRCPGSGICCEGSDESSDSHGLAHRGGRSRGGLD